MLLLGCILLNHGAVVPFWVNIAFTLFASVPDITTVALVVLDGVGFVVADVNVYVELPWPVNVSLVTSIVVPVLKFDPVNTRFPS